MTDIAILAMPETTASVVYGMYDLFRSAGRDWPMVVHGRPGTELLRPRIVARRIGPLRAANDVVIQPDLALADVPPAAIVCVPEVMVAPEQPVAGRFAEEIAWLGERYAAGTTIATACSGALLLAEAGLLRGRDATSHWAYCDVLAQRYDDIRVRPGQALVVAGDGGRLVMAGGGTSWLDLALFLIARIAGVEEAMRLARLNLIDWHDAGQQPYARLVRSRQAGDAVVARCQTWIAEHYRRPAPVAAMARLSGLPERTFSRRFRTATGMAPLEYVHTLRLEEAKQMLECEDRPVEQIAHDVGYEDAGFFARLFRRKVGMTPARYRLRFGGLRRTLQGGSPPGRRPARAAVRGGVADSPRTPERYRAGTTGSSR